jgi:8-oxo-dGTP pyrophosphatase MutT (NUDIX family)
MPAMEGVPTSPAEAAVPRAAATVVLLRDAGGGPEVLLLRRHSRAGFMPSAWVFPGGILDPGDADVPDRTWTGIDPAALAPRFGLSPAEVLAHHVAAVRETFEEAGVLLATHADGRRPDVGGEAFTTARHVLNDRADHLDWGAFCAAQDLVMDLGAFTYLAHWITPIQEPRRYDTRFFVAALPEGAVAAQDDVETTDARWIRPADALADPDVWMIFPAERTLERLAGAATAAEAIADARALESIAAVQPHMVFTDEGEVDIIHPDDPRYPHDLYGTAR